VSPVLVPLLFVIHTLSLHDALPISIAFALMAFIVVVRGLIKNERPVYWLILAGLFCLSLVLHIIPLTIGENLGHDRFLSSGLAFFVIGAMYPNYVELLKRIKVRQKVSIGIDRKSTR